MEILFGVSGIHSYTFPDTQFKIKLCGFEQCLAAQLEFVLSNWQSSAIEKVT